MTELVTSFRMYEATPRARSGWRALFGRVFEETGAGVSIVEHAFPRSIDSLWREPGLCCAFMCGWPFARSDRGMQAIAAPVPSPSRYAGLPRYRSEFLVRDDRGFASLEDTFGRRIGWMAEDSQSGFNAPRALLARYVTAARCVLYRESRGPLVTPARTLDALRSDEVDVVALDGYFLDLVRAHEPQRLQGVRTLAETPWTPIPLLVAAPGVDPALVARLRAHLLALHEVPAYRPLLDEVLLARFAAADVSRYLALDDLARFAAARGYGAIA